MHPDHGIPNPFGQVQVPVLLHLDALVVLDPAPVAGEDKAQKALQVDRGHKGVHIDADLEEGQVDVDLGNYVGHGDSGGVRWAGSWGHGDSGGVRWVEGDSGGNRRYGAVGQS